MFFRKFFWLIAFILLIPFSTVKGQILTPVTWEFNIEETQNGTYKVVMHAEMEEKWHVYGRELESDDGPVATEVLIEENPDIELIGGIEDGGNLKTEHDPVFDMMISFYDKTVTFTQEFRALKDTEVKGSVYYMTCNDKTCIPPEEELFGLKVKASPTINVTVEEVPESSTEIAGDKVEIYEPVTWSFKIEEGENGSYFLVAGADIEETWHVYARVLESDEGPIATEFTIDENDQIELIGEIVDRGEMKTEYDPNFMMDLSYFDTHVEFVQEFKLKGAGTKVSGNVYFMTCDDEKCLPPEEIGFELEVGDAAAAVLPEEGTTETEVSEGLSFWATFLKGFFGGFIALLTPCVFPMIPLTVSFFTKQSKTRAKGISNAIMYGASIIGIYVLLGYGVTAIFGADALNALSTNVWFNLGFCVLLTVFAISFFGGFEITLPSSWVNKADMASDKGGMMGIFFMAFTLSLVSFSCTGPIIGTLLVDAAVNGGVAGPLIGMFGFSLALALPFALFAAFPGWLNSLPSSGGWLNSVKVVLGFLELAFAFKFLSNADLVVQAGLLKRELFIAIWIAIFGLMTAYLLGFFSLPHDSKKDHIGVGRLMFAVVSLMFTIYLIPGIWGAPLQMISGFPPPKFYSESPNGLGGGAMIVSENPGNVVGEPEHCPHQLNCFHDYDEGMAYAKEVGKPVMLDFTGWACVNCRKMEEQVWSDPSVLKILREDLVLISLYVDEKIELPEEEQREVVIGTKTKMLKTVGNKWSYFQATRYNTNSQPYYVILDHDENTLNGSAAYDPDVPKFRNWLQEGVDIFNEKNVAEGH